MLDRKIKIGITTGDVNGIGLELILKTLTDNTILEMCTPIVYGSSKVLAYHRKMLNNIDINFISLKDTFQPNSKSPYIVNCWDGDVKIELGQATSLAGKYALQSLECATKDLLANKIDALVTAPVNKHTISEHLQGFKGQTEYFAQKTNTSAYMMLLVSDILKIGLVTTHTPIENISKEISKEKILSKLEILNQTLIKDFGIPKPKLAVLALNPHAGDNGLLGSEEQTIIAPAITEASQNGILAFGPYSADGFFGKMQFKKFDAVLAMYHDQALLPFKLLAFEAGVNYTAGLPIIRTSPDHGTAYDIVGKNIASESSFRQAMFLAIDIFKQRALYANITKNPLPISNKSVDNKEF